MRVQRHPIVCDRCDRLKVIYRGYWLDEVAARSEFVTPSNCRPILLRTQHHDGYVFRSRIMLESLQDTNATDARHVDVQQHEVRCGEFAIRVLPSPGHVEQCLVSRAKPSHLGCDVADLQGIGVTVALTLVGMPFVVRSVQPALAEVQRELEDAAESLGASPFYIFRRIIFPTALPAVLSGFALGFAHGAGEFGSVVFILEIYPTKRRSRRC